MATSTEIFSAEIKFKHLEGRFLQAPKAVFPIVRDGVFRMTAGFRKRWLAAHKVKFRGSDKRNFPLLAKIPSALPKGAGGGAAKRIVFVVVPAKGEIGKDLGAIKAAVFAVSKAWLGLEKGGRTRAKRASKLAVPMGVTLDVQGRVKGKWNSPAKFTKANKTGKQRVLVAIHNPTTNSLGLYWQKAVGAGKNKRYVYLPAFALIDAVEQPRLLNFYRTFDGEKGNRTKVGRIILEKILQHMEGGGKGGKKSG